MTSDSSRELYLSTDREDLYRRAIEVTGAVPYYQNYETDEYEFIGQGILELTGYEPHELTPDLYSSLTIERILLGELAELSFEEAIKKARETEGISWNAQYLIRCRNGERRWLENSAIQIRDRSGKLVGSLGILRDITQEKSHEEKLAAQTKQQATVAALGQQALEDGNVHKLMDEAVKRVAETLDVEFCKVLELLPDGKKLLLCSGVGWKEGLAGHAAVDAGFDSQAGYTLQSDHPVVVDDLLTETRFKGPSLFHEHHIRSGISVKIHGRENVFGVLGAHTARVRAFTAEEVHFLEAVAHLLANAIERERSEESMRHAAEQYRTLFEATSDGLLIYDGEGRIVEANKAACIMHGYSYDELIGMRGDAIVHQDSWQLFVSFLNAIHKGNTFKCEAKNVHKDGTEIYIEVIGKSILFEGQVLPFAIVHDVTERKIAEIERKKLEAQLRQAQKMEAVGQLAGGIAHDFNNLLQAILGYTELVKLGIEPEEKSFQDLEQVQKAAERASGLTRQLLTFSRRQVLQLTELNLGAVVQDLVKLIRRVIREDIHLELSIAGELKTVRADLGMLEQVLMNLCVNARDAMPNGGQLLIEVQNVGLDETFCESAPWARPGDYVILTVTDTGMGMSKEVQEHIFEPFFTTKEKSKGTGLGLSVVYGIVKQHSGFIHVYSDLGQGTTFKIYLPAHELDVLPDAETAEVPVPSGTETILLAEDDEVVRTLATRILENRGYTVISAQDGEDAINLYNDNVEKIDLVILDVVMPKLNGQAVYEAIKAIRPEIPILFSSGYSPNSDITEFIKKAGTYLIQKPFIPNDLLRMVRNVLEI